MCRFDVKYYAGCNSTITKRLEPYCDLYAQAKTLKTKSICVLPNNLEITDKIEEGCGDCKKCRSDFEKFANLNQPPNQSFSAFARPLNPGKPPYSEFKIPSNSNYDVFLKRPANSSDIDEVQKNKKKRTKRGNSKDRSPIKRPLDPISTTVEGIAGLNVTSDGKKTIGFASPFSYTPVPKSISIEPVNDGNPTQQKPQIGNFKYQDPYLTHPGNHETDFVGQINECERNFKSEDLISHSKDNSQKIYGCEDRICGQRFDNRDQLIAHHKLHGIEKNPYWICGTCYKTFEYIKYFKKHQQNSRHCAPPEKNEKKKKSIQCKYCEKLISPRGMTSHEKTHKTFPCLFEGCNQMFKTSGWLDDHLKLHDWSLLNRNR